MGRYNFHLKKTGERVLIDEEGAELPDLETAANKLSGPLASLWLMETRQLPTWTRWRSSSWMIKVMNLTTSLLERFCRGAFADIASSDEFFRSRSRVDGLDQLLAWIRYHRAFDVVRRLSHEAPKWKRVVAAEGIDVSTCAKTWNKLQRVFEYVLAVNSC